MKKQRSQTRRTSKQDATLDLLLSLATENAAGGITFSVDPAPAVQKKAIERLKDVLKADPPDLGLKEILEADVLDPVLKATLGTEGLSQESNVSIDNQIKRLQQLTALRELLDMEIEKIKAALEARGNLTDVPEGQHAPEAE